MSIFHQYEKCALLIVTLLGRLSFTVQNDVCAQFDTRRLISHSSAEDRKDILDRNYYSKQSIFICVKTSNCSWKVLILWL